MKNDLKKITDIDTEMSINDMLYKKMQYELELVEAMIKNDTDKDEEEFLDFLLDECYFYRRVLSVFANDDIPITACIGLFMLDGVLPTLFDKKDDFIGDSDSDNDIFRFVIEYGYRHCDELRKMDADEFEEIVTDIMDDYCDLVESDGE